MFPRGLATFELFNDAKDCGATELKSDKSARKAAVSVRWRHFSQNGGAFIHIEAEAAVFE